MNDALNLLPCPFCGSVPDLDAYGYVSCPVGLCSQEEQEDYAERGLECGNDAVMAVAEWQKQECRAKSAERLAVIESLLSVIGAAETTGNAIISSELWKRVEHAREK